MRWFSNIFLRFIWAVSQPFCHYEFELSLTNRLSTSFLSTSSKSDEVFSRMSKTCESRSNLQDELKVSIKKFPRRKLSSNLVSEIITSTVPLICWTSNLNLFQIKFMFCWAKTDWWLFARHTDFEAVLKFIVFLDCK